MILEKVYDELMALIEDLQKKVGSGGSEVTITPALESGVKVADYEIDGEEGSIYAPAPYTPLDYSTTEQDTGVKWIDGTEVYQKTISIGALPNNTTKNVAHGVTDIDRVINAYMFATTSTHTSTIIPLVSNSNLSNNVSYGISDENVSVYSKTDVSIYDAYLTIFYTKIQPEAKKTTKKK